jgi:transcription initiation factor IIF auxiliary subunit
MYPEAVKAKKVYIKERVMAEVLIGNTTIFLNNGEDNSYDWELYVASVPGKQPIHELAEAVEIMLHPTFVPPRVKFQLKADRPIKLRRIVWGTFRIDIRIFWKMGLFNEAHSDFHHDLQFVPNQ